MDTCKIEAVLESIEASLWEDVEGAEIRLEAVKDCLYALAYGVDALKEHLTPSSYNVTIPDDITYYDQLQKIRDKLVEKKLIVM